MRLVFALVLLVGIGLAGAAVYMTRGYVSDYQAKLQQASSQQNIPTTEIYVANKTLTYGQEIKPEDVRLVKFPNAAMPDGVFTKAEVLFPTGPNTTRLALRVMEKNEAITEIKVTKPGEDAGVATRLSVGMRAFAINVDVTTGVSGFLRPGDRVDVYWTGRGVATGTAPAAEITQLIDTGIRIVAVDQMANLDSAAATIARTITVEVSPQQVAGLAQAQSTGRLSLSLLGAQDTTNATASAVDQRSLLGVTAAPVVVEAPVVEERVCTVKTRKGAETVETVIPCSN